MQGHIPEGTLCNQELKIPILWILPNHAVQYNRKLAYSTNGPFFSALGFASISSGTAGPAGLLRIMKSRVPSAALQMQGWAMNTIFFHALLVP
jgi:hypothetical protein